MVRINRFTTLWLLVFATACQPVIAQSVQTQSHNLPGQEIWATFNHSEEISDLVVQGDYLWATTEAGVAHWNIHTGEYLKFHSERGLAPNDVQAIAVAADGTIWFGTDEGASRLTPNGNWSTFTALNGLVDDDVQVIAVAADGTIWFGTGEGVSRLTPDGSWSTFTALNGLVDDDVRAIAIAADGAVWFGTDEGISRLTPGGSQASLWNSYHLRLSYAF